jgi:hypothetical protein
MPATAEARTALTLVQAPAAPAASRVDSIMAAEAAADNAMNADATCTALTLVQAAAASRGESVMAAQAAADNALNADATEVEA